MKLLSSLVNPKDNRYVIYYSALLVAVITTIILKGIGIIHLPTLDIIILHFEGFMSMFMLARNEEVGNSFVIHLSKLQVLSGRRNLQ